MKRNAFLFLLFVLLSLGLGTGARAQSAVSTGIAADLAFETGGFMRQSAYRSPDSLNNDMLPDGAYGVNKGWDSTHSGQWFIEAQRAGGDLVLAGVADSRPDVITRGLTVIRWGFAQQNPDGGWDCPDVFHSVSFFVESTAHALLVLQASSYAAQFAPDIAAMKPLLLRGARWMARPDIDGQSQPSNVAFTHRRYLVGGALGMTGVLCGDAGLVRRARAYIRQGLALQDPSGYNPEKGGYDSSYHAVGLWYASRCYTLVADDSMRPAMYAMLQQANAWEASRITANGAVKTYGNTRVGGLRDETDRTGKLKTVAIGQVFRAFAYWAQLSGDPSYTTLAQKVAVAAHMYNGTIPIGGDPGDPGPDAATAASAHASRSFVTSSTARPTTSGDALPDNESDEY